MYRIRCNKWLGVGYNFKYTGTDYLLAGIYIFRTNISAGRKWTCSLLHFRF